MLSVDTSTLINFNKVLDKLLEDIPARRQELEDEITNMLNVETSSIVAEAKAIKLVDDFDNWFADKLEA